MKKPIQCMAAFRYMAAFAVLWALGVGSAGAQGGGDSADLQSAKAHHEKGYTLLVLGQRDASPARLEQALEEFREALRGYTRARAPLEWARVQYNVGQTLQVLGHREQGTKRFEQAVETYREALKELTHERAPLEWAGVQSGLGSALSDLGQRGRSSRRLEEAIAIYREVLKKCPCESDPMIWARTQNYLGIALQVLAGWEARPGYKFEHNPEQLNKEAVAAYREALKVWTRESAPMEWAAMQHNLGNILQALGSKESGTTRFKEAAVAYRAVLTVLTRDYVPLDWVTVQNSLAGALSAIAERDYSPAGLQYLEEARQALEQALEVALSAKAAHHVEMVNGSLWRLNTLIQMRGG